MFKSKALKEENQKLKDELFILKQISESLEQDMIRFLLDETGRVTAINQMVEKNWALKTMILTANILLIWSLNMTVTPNILKR